MLPAAKVRDSGIVPSGPYLAAGFELAQLQPDRLEMARCCVDLRDCLAPDCSDEFDSPFSEVKGSCRLMTPNPSPSPSPAQVTAGVSKLHQLYSARFMYQPLTFVSSCFLSCIELPSGLCRDDGRGVAVIEGEAGVGMDCGACPDPG
jgi:hypothetical protein